MPRIGECGDCRPSLVSTEVENLFRDIAEDGNVRVPGPVRASIGIGVTDADIDLFLTALERVALRR